MLWAYQLVQTLPTMQIPMTVQAVLAARIDRLPAAEKRLLLHRPRSWAQRCPFRCCRRSLELSEAAVHDSLRHLQAAEFLYETHLFTGARLYLQARALIHEVAYGGLPQERRRALHARIVEALEALAPDRVAEQVERLAYHALRGKVWDKTVTYCRAGRRQGARPHRVP